MKNWKAALVFLCIFLAGAVAGGFFGLRVGCQRIAKANELQKREEARPRRPIDDWSKRRLGELHRRLKLTDEQKEKLEPLILNAQIEFRRLRERSMQQTNEALNQFDVEVLVVLNDQQKVEYTRMIKERQEKFEKAAAERAAGRERGAHSGGPPSPPERAGDEPPMPGTAGPLGDRAPSPRPPPGPSAD